MHYTLVFCALLLVFHSKFGLDILLTGNVKWLYCLDSDMLPDISTWQYYRYSPLWSGAPGVFKGYGYPQVTGIGNTNIVPLIGMPLKLINRWLPEQFQYFGLFLFSCYALQAWFADRLLGICKVPYGLGRFAGVIIVLLAAPFLDRYCHLALCAHWMILAALCTYCSGSVTLKKSLWAYGILGFVAVMTHPYLVLFPLLIAFADGLKRKNGPLRWWASLIFPLSSIAGILLGGYISGVFSLSAGGSAADGFGMYSSNFNTFWNNMGKTNFTLLDLPAYGTGQYEGYAYLGAGVLLLWISVLLQPAFYRWIGRACHQYWSMIIVMVIAAVYAFAFRITWNEHLIWDAHLGSGTLLYRLASVFRSSGRYIWLPYYIVLLVPIVYYGANYKWKYGPYAILLPAIVLQVADMNKALSRCVSAAHYRTGPDWELLSSFAARTGAVYTYPAFVRTISFTDDMQYLTAVLGPKQIRITAGHLPRPDYRTQDQLRDTLQQMSESGNWLLNSSSVLITKPEEIAYFSALQLKHTIMVRKLGKYSVLYAVTDTYIDSVARAMHLPQDTISTIGLSDYLRQQHAALMIVVSKDEASEALRPATRKQLDSFSSILSGIQSGEAYAGIFSKGQSLKEVRLPAGQHLELQYTHTLSGTQKAEIRLRATSRNGKEPYLFINEKEYRGFNRGLNIFLFNDQMQLIGQRYIDLYKTYYLNQ